MSRWPAVGTAFVLVLLLAAAGCATPESPAPPGSDTLSLFVSIPPQKFMVQRIAGDLVSVEVMLPPGQSPATYEPSPQQMARLSKATALIRIGVPFEERLMTKISDTIPGLEVVDVREGITLRRMTAHHHHDGHHHGHTHEAGAPDPHTWLDPRLAMVQARTIHDALVRLLPEKTAELEAGLDRLTTELQEADRLVGVALEPLRGRTIYVFHPAYGYLTDAYGLEQVAVEVEGKEPSARRLAGLIEQARRDEVSAIFFQPQFSRSSAETLALEIGCTAVEMDPLAEDYVANLKEMAASISSALSVE